MADCEKCGTLLLHHEDRDGNDEVYCPVCDDPKRLTRPHPEQSGAKAFQEGLSRLAREGAASNHPGVPCPECGAVNWKTVGWFQSCGGKDGHPCGHLLGVNEPLGEPTQVKAAGPSPCDFEPCVGQKCRISCDKCMTIIKEVRELDEKGWDGVLKPTHAPKGCHCGEVDYPHTHEWELSPDGKVRRWIQRLEPAAPTPPKGG